MPNNVGSNVSAVKCDPSRNVASLKILQPKPYIAQQSYCTRQLNPDDHLHEYGSALSTVARIADMDLGPSHLPMRYCSSRFWSSVDGKPRARDSIIPNSLPADKEDFPRESRAACHEAVSSQASHKI